MTKRLEHRAFATVAAVRDSDDGVTLEGYASTFSQPYDMGWYEETVDPAAFKRTLGQNPDVRLLINHCGLPLARTASKTLSLSTDDKGLMVSARLDQDDPDVAALIPKIRRGDLNQMSFAFRVTEDIWEDNMTRRTMLSLDLNNGDVSMVTYPANPAAKAALRADGTNIEAVSAALQTLGGRDATEQDVAEVLTRALTHFRADPPAGDGPELDTDAELDAIMAGLDLRSRRLRLL
jgi:HK97 family phage prohead protease